MGIEEMRDRIEKFCQIYAGTAIGEETRNKLDNLSDCEDLIEDLYQELEEDGYI